MYKGKGSVAHSLIEIICGSLNGLLLSWTVECVDAMQMESVSTELSGSVLNVFSELRDGAFCLQIWCEVKQCYSDRKMITVSMQYL